MEKLDLNVFNPKGDPKAKVGQGRQKKSGGESKNPPQAQESKKWAAYIFLAMVFFGLMAGCKLAANSARPEDPALTALGQASIKIMDERMRSPFIALSPTGEAGSKLGQAFVLDGVFEGPVSDALMGLSKALNYGLWVKNARAGRLFVTVGPSRGGQTILWLINDLNKQLKDDRAVIGIDSVNKRLVLSATEVDR
ncbi:MAG: hypothetical protein LBF38_09130 [Deltaproteobacteria bacterium]|jgi:hypothetical protein|nr:hypothetical protein [Deltaproteobacteria bacterium]